jgi:hypothetical protein
MKEKPSLSAARAAVPSSIEVVDITTLRLDPDNPRIRFQFTHGAVQRPTTPDALLEIVKDQPGYEPLQLQIRKAGGIHDPLIIRHDGRIVEGNSRFAALMVLSKMGSKGTPWSKAPVRRLAPDVSEQVVHLLMADYHIAGKTKWRASAQADQIYQMVRSGISMETIADATRMTQKKVAQHLAAFKFLVQEVLPIVDSDKLKKRQEILESKFSHALEFTRLRSFEGIRNDTSDRRLVAKLIATDSIKGQETRKLPLVMANEKAKETLRKHGFAAGVAALNEDDPTADSSLLKAMRSMTAKLRAVDGPDMRLLKNDARAFEVLSQLSNAADVLIGFAEPKVKKRKTVRA